jgi:hypothetical protein
VIGRRVAPQRPIRVREVKAMQRVGFVGVGTMGEPMAANLLRAG